MENNLELEHLKRKLQGNVIAAGDPDYDAACRDLIWNGRKPTRRPAIIVKAASVEDVLATVRFAATQGLRVSARGGGHHWSGIAMQDDILLDLAALNHVYVDMKTRTAEVGPAARNGDLARALGTHGLAFPLGHCATVPMSGYLLGGGIGWNSGAWGVACFNVESLDVVTADGELRHVSATEYPDIFWAARGAGPEFFGVVTAYRLRLHPLPRSIMTSVFTYSFERAAEVEAWMLHTMTLVPSNLEFTAMIASAPPPLATAVDKVVCGIATVFADDEGEARRILARVAAGAPSGMLDTQQNQPTPFDVLYEIIGQFFPQGRRYMVDTFWAKNGADGFLRQLASATVLAPSPESFSLVTVLPPAMAASDLPDAAYSVIGPMIGLSYAIWRSPEQDKANILWLRETAQAMKPLTKGCYIGESDLDRSDRLRESFSPAAWSRLKMLQSQYDPAGIFRTAPQRSAPLDTAA